MVEALDKEGIFVRKLQTNNVAFHCPLLDGCLDALRAGGPSTLTPVYLSLPDGCSLGQSCRRCWEVHGAWEAPYWLSNPAWLSQQMCAPSLISFWWPSCRSGEHHP